MVQREIGEHLPGMEPSIEDRMREIDNKLGDLAQYVAYVTVKMNLLRAERSDLFMQMVEQRRAERDAECYNQPSLPFQPPLEEQ